MKPIPTWRDDIKPEYQSIIQIAAPAMQQEIDALRQRCAELESRVDSASLNDYVEKCMGPLRTRCTELERDAAPTKVLTEHSGCGHGTQIDQLTMRLNPGDKVVLVMGAYSAAMASAPKGE